MADPRDQFGPTAQDYLQSSVHSNEAALARTVEIAKPSGGVILDVATGAGHTAFAFAPYGDLIIASDITPEMLHVAAATAAKRGLSNVKPIFGWAEALPIASSSLSGVTCRLGAHHFRDVKTFVAEAHRSLEPGGWLLLVDNVGVEDDDADDLLDKLEVMRDRSHVRNYRESVWLNLLKGAGFAIEFQEIIPKPLNAVDWLRRQRVPEDQQAILLDMIASSQGWLRQYLRPHGDGELLTFHLHEMLVLGRKR